MRRAGRKLSVMVTCEHGGNRIPAAYQPLFAGAREVLQSHRGYDPGTLEFAKRLSRALPAPLFYSTTSRLLVELNRTLGHRQLFSEFTRSLPEPARQEVIARYYHPYRESVEQQAAQLLSQGRVLHLSIHSFSPVMRGHTRRTDLGLLFDPSRRFESAFCDIWRRELRAAAPELKTHFNLPYRGTSDGFTVALRKEFPDPSYAGVELEINQRFPLGDRPAWRNLQRRLIASLRAALTSALIQAETAGAVQANRTHAAR